MAWGWVEAEVERLYKSAGFAPDEAVAPGALIRAILGPRSVRFLPEELIATGTLVRVGAEWRVYLRRGLDERRLRFVALHELAHWALGQGASESECDALAAGLIAPRRAFEVALERCGRSYPRLARWFRATQSFAALRTAEVTGAPTALVAPSGIRLRGEGWPWPTVFTPELVTASKLPGIRKVRLTDDRDRLVLVGR